MANTLKLKRSSVASKVPLTTDLQLGELAINTNDGKLYTKKNAGTDVIVDLSGSVTSVAASGGSTGLTFSGGPITTSGTLTLGGTLAVASGGTGATDAATARTNLGLAIGTNVQAYDADLAAIAALAGTSGLLRKTAADTWSLDTNTYLTSAVTTISFGTTGLTPSTATSGAVTVAGTLSLANGGTGATTQAGAANAILPSQTSNSGKYLTTDGTNVSWGTVSGTGTVTSVAASGGTTGLTFTGSPITTSGTLTLGGTLAVANGGTGATDAGTARTNLGLAIGTNVQAWDADLDAIAALAGTSGFLKKTAANTWTLDTATYLTANQSITLSGDVSGTGSTAITTTIGANKVTNAMLAQVATATFKGRTTAATGNVEDLTATQATALLDVFSSTLKGLAPASGGGTANFLRADGTWAAPAGTGVSTISFGTTGLTPSTATSGAVTVAGTLVAANGGTGQSSYAVGDILYASTTTALSKLAGVATGNALISGGVGTAPSWGKIGLTTHVSGTLGLTNGGTNASLTAANGGVVYSTASALAITAAGTAGQALVSAGAAAPTWTTLTLENLPDAWVKRAVRVATTANITLSGTQTIDGVAVVAGDRVLVKDQTTTSANGIYVVAAGAWTRATDADTASELSGATVAVDSGTVNGGKSFDTDFKSTDTLGTTALTWARVLDTGTIGVDVQAYDADLAAIAALAGTSGLLRKTAADTWSLDTNTYLTSAVTTINFGTTGLTPSTAASGAVTVAGTLAAANGGTGQSSYAVGDILYASTTSALSKLAGVATGNALISGGVATAPSWGKIGLTTHISGTLAIGNGGTGATTQAGAANAILPSQTSQSGKYLTTDGTNVSWGTVSGGATGGGTDAVFNLNDKTVTTSYSIPSTKHAVSVGPLTINSGVTVTIPSNSRWVVL